MTKKEQIIKSSLQSASNSDSPVFIPLTGIQVPRFQKPYSARSLFASFRFAFEGIGFAYRTERNFRIHSFMAMFAVVMGFICQIQIFEWAMISGLIGLVLFAELTNTAVENLVDMITQGKYEVQAKSVKDVAAAAVLVTAMTSVVCGSLIFMPYLVKMFAAG